MCENDVTVIIEETELFTTIVIDDNCTQVTIIAEALGAQGLSAYDIAVANGFVGTETEWLESLKSITDLVTSGFGEDIEYNAETQTLTIDKYNFLDLARGFKFGTIPFQVSTTTGGVIFQYEYITKNLYRYIANDLSEDAFYEEITLTTKLCEKQITL